MILKDYKNLMLSIPEEFDNFDIIFTEFIDANIRKNKHINSIAIDSVAEEIIISEKNITNILTNKNEQGRDNKCNTR